MKITEKIKTLCILLIFLLTASPLITAQEKRAMELEDIMNFHHMYLPAISFSGDWLAYGAAPDRGLSVKRAICFLFITTIPKIRF